MRAPSISTGREIADAGRLRRKVTIRFAPGGSRWPRYGSSATRALSSSSGRTIVRKLRPSRSFMAASALRSSAAGEPVRASKTTFPLERTVPTSAKPAASKLALSSAILAFVGMTPRRKAA
jgi:hypothetical protein